MDTFPIVKRKDEAAFGTYRTKDLILSAYDAMAEAKIVGSHLPATLAPGGSRMTQTVERMLPLYEGKMIHPTTTAGPP